MSGSVCCSAQKESKKAPMKRENKAYSYKEQIIELELQEVKGPSERQQISPRF